MRLLSIRPAIARQLPLCLAAALIALAPLQPALAQTAPAPAPTYAGGEGKYLHYLNPTQFDPSLLLPAPYEKDSAAANFELETLHRLIASASKDRMAQALTDAEVEDPSLFNATVSMDLKNLPATWALLTLVQDEAYLATGYSKAFFKRMRPYSADPTIPLCEAKADPAKPVFKSYPSGHATVGYAVGYALARLIPAKADKILARARDYAMSRQYCGAHYPSDTEAAHTLATLAAAQLMADPRLASQIAAARAELAKQ
ncbi:phosphatase PAP2 family protein [Novosphingobium sp. FSY-8]|uniref:Acid phosphatase n=1 Tax=Novosphingobium ovatum TaxID=1908523 RepID=A0ABW9XHW4_9SPHN|nr:phosphatase PAP2 family protein [Novosphingobium ovatum]NBC38157.1 phosphatase PAP2 family protein [Novosphingobium ovatum]